MKTHTKLLILLIVFSTVLGCQSKKASEENQDEVVELKPDTLNVNNNLPPPSEVAARIEATGAPFNHEALLNLGNVSRYIVDNRKGKNSVLLGAYFSNMEYLLAYGKTDSAAMYFYECKNLAASIGIEKLFIKTFKYRFSEMIEADTTLQQSLQNMVSATQDTLKQEDLRMIQIGINVGYTLEGIHELINMVKGYPKDELPEESLKLVISPIFRAVGNQEERITKIISYLEEANLGKDDLFYDDFIRLKETYKGLDFASKLESGDVNVLINDPLYADLVTNIENLREQYTK